jgi:hypothetical protein
MDTKVTGYLSDRFAGLEDHLDGFGLELGTEPTTLLGHAPILKLENMSKILGTPHPDLNPVEALWSHLKRSIGNIAVRGADQLQAIIKNRLKSIQYRTELLDGFLAHIGLTIEPDTT